MECWLALDGMPSPLRVCELEATEGLSEPSECHAVVLGNGGDVVFGQMLGTSARVELRGDERPHRDFQGVVAAIVHMGWQGEHALYRFTLRSWLWLLGLSSDCRIFQRKTLVQIVDEVFSAYPATFAWECVPDDTPMDYCVQYGESDFDFVSRLLAAAGIYYFFRQTPSRDQLVLVDSPVAHPALAGGESRRWAADGGPADDTIHAWRSHGEVTTTSMALVDFSFDHATSRETAVVVTGADALPEEAHGTYERYEHPGDFRTRTDGEAQARRRLDALNVAARRAVGVTQATDFVAGGLFALTGHPFDEENGRYVLTRTRYRIECPPPASGSVAMARIVCSFDALRATRPFRAPAGRKSVIAGAQTAMVVGGPEGSLVVDSKGRVKVRFHWDRAGEASGDCSCWIRVAQPMAGARWGAMFLPRVGQEVVVTFLDGDPDRPLISGGVYNAGQQPPYTLPDEASRSGFRSRSLSGDEVYNELRFDDRAKAERLLIHAGRDKATIVRNDTLSYVGNERHCTVEGHRFTRTCGDAHRETLGARLDKVDGDAHIDIGGQQVGRVGKGMALDVSGEGQISFGASLAVASGADIDGKSGGSITLDAGTKLTLRVGTSSLVLDASGVAINGTKVSIDGSAGVAINGGGASTAASARSPKTVAPRAPVSPRRPDDESDGNASHPS
ncbi:type VI secretion system secreted protein VgrG [Luteibacter rhizovicinus]|uniref:Type VI secretion system secreted protein VgrG n=1 Tax=Luteibacter rhizovicinus TaxID=242606 RepID=A0A4R3YXM7_9GAMM|nr:type VI secretion system tip protein TssI/VgrG [Luteibacter rhizovicinus]TCV97302.1 type VI secretion system secreted protein VgrG [Luteibacter rhizovicinus]